MVKKGYEQYDYGIYRGQHQDFDIRDKHRNLSTHTRLMLNKSLNMFEYHNLPDTIPERELERILQTSGYGGIIELEGELYAVWGGLGGEQDAYYRPTLMTVANPGLRYSNGNSYSETLEIGKDVVLMRNDDNMVGLIPIYAKYGTLMSETDLTIYIMLINKRSENIISVSDDNTAESAKKYLESLEEGKIGYIQESKLYDSLQTNPTHSQGTASNFTELTELQQYLKGSMYNEIGLNANFNMKRERLNTSEVEMNSEALYPLVDNMLYNRRLALEEVNEKFGTDIQVEFNSSWDYRLGNHEDTGEVPFEFEEAYEDEHAPIDLDKYREGGADDDEQGDDRPHTEDDGEQGYDDRGAENEPNALEGEREPDTPEEERDPQIEETDESEDITLEEEEQEEEQRHPEEVDSQGVLEQDIEIIINEPSEESDQEDSEAHIQDTIIEEEEQDSDSDNEAHEDDMPDNEPETLEEEDNASNEENEGLDEVIEVETEVDPEPDNEADIKAHVEVEAEVEAEAHEVVEPVEVAEPVEEPQEELDDDILEIAEELDEIVEEEVKEDQDESDDEPVEEDDNVEEAEAHEEVVEEVEEDEPVQKPMNIIRIFQKLNPFTNQ